MLPPAHRSTGREQKRGLRTVIFLGLATHAVAGELAEKQWSVLFPDHTAIPERFGVPIRERFEASENMRLPEVPMPVPAPGRDMAPSPVETKE
jgi:hypothetical protein